jgi:hypothetical protein
MNQLDVEFARHYINALRCWSNDSPFTPQSWAVLFRRVCDEDLRSLPCAVAGINAHINYDLPLALLATWERLGHPAPGSPQHHDYLVINRVFEESIALLRRRYLEGWQRQIDRINLGIDDWYQNLLIVLTRNVAWDRAQRLWAVRDDPRAASDDLVDRRRYLCRLLALLGEDALHDLHGVRHHVQLRDAQLLQQAALVLLARHDHVVHQLLGLRRQLDPAHSPVLGVLVACDVPPGDEPVDDARHGGEADAHRVRDLLAAGRAVEPQREEGLQLGHGQVDREERVGAVARERHLHAALAAQDAGDHRVSAGHRCS